MLSSIDFNTYNRVATMNSKLNGFMRDALMTKIGMTTTISALPSNSSPVKSFGIGNNVDIYA